MSDPRPTAGRALPETAVDLPHHRVRVSAPPEGRVLQIQARRGATIDADGLAFLVGDDACAARRIAPGQWVVVADAPITSEEVAAAAARLADVAHVFDIGPGRVRLRLDGDDAVAVLSNHVVIDLAPRAFPVGASTATLVGHISVWLTRLGETSFEIVVPRSFAVAVRDELVGHG